MAYVPTVNGKDAVWVLMADADYATADPAEADLPPYAYDTHASASDRLHAFPPHFSVLRVEEGSHKGTLIHLAGGDWRITAGGTAADVTWDSTYFAKSNVIRPLLDKVPSDPNEIKKYDSLDKVWPDAIAADVTSALTKNRLGARFLIDRGSLTADTGSQKFAFDQVSEDCKASGTTLVQSVIQTFTASSVTFERVGGAPFTVTDDGKGIEIMVQNETLEAIAFPDRDGESHLESFRWLYHLSASPLSVGVKYHAWPCYPTVGGTRCPVKELSP
jgi:hypothetical protein